MFPHGKISIGTDQIPKLFQKHFFLASFAKVSLFIYLFIRYTNLLSLDSIQNKEEVLQWACKEVRQAHIDVNPALEETEIIDITVSFDGSWHKRGHTSSHGLGFVIDVLTGQFTFIVGWSLL